MEWLFANWEFVLLGFFVLEKIVKVTPWPYDDIIVDVIGAAIKHVAAKKKGG